MQASESRRKVVITGMGMITPIGLTLEDNWQSLMAGKSGVGKITRFDPSRLSTQFGAEIQGFDPTEYLEPKKARQYDRYIHFSIAAADNALADADLDKNKLPKEQTGALVGSGMGGMQTFVNNAQLLLEKRATSGFTIFHSFCYCEYGRRVVNNSLRYPRP